MASAIVACFCVRFYSAKHMCMLSQAVLEPFLYEYTAERGGSISAEHGLGQMKNQYMGCAVCSHPLQLCACAVAVYTC
jgi:FAD linked oxidases, C-terminal domain